MKIDILVATPKKLNFLLENSMICLKRFDLYLKIYISSIKWLVLDEGDLLLDKDNKNNFCSQVL